MKKITLTIEVDTEKELQKVEAAAIKGIYYGLDVQRIGGPNKVKIYKCGQEEQLTERTDMANEFIAQHKVSYQISPDEWDTSSRTLKLSDNTTVKEILDWYKKYDKDGMLEVRLIQIQSE